MSCFWSWLHYWQDLVAGFIGAAALIWTVRWTLRAEHRRQEMEAKALRTALGAELRHFAARALDGYRKIVQLLEATSNFGSVVTISPQQLGSAAHFPEPVIYPHTAQGLGALGDHAHNIVFFFGQVSLVRDALQHLREAGQLPVIARLQLVNFAQALFNAADAAVEALPAFADPKWVEGDKVFTRQVTEARESQEALRSPSAPAPG